MFISLIPTGLPEPICLTARSDGYTPRLPGYVLLVLNTTYAEYMIAAETITTSLELAREAENVMVLRTFSKIYALAGLASSLGFGSSRVIDVVNRVRGTFNVTTTAQLAGLAALDDQAWIDQVREHTITWRRWTTDALRKVGLDVPDSVGNFRSLPVRWCR